MEFGREIKSSLCLSSLIPVTQHWVIALSWTNRGRDRQTDRGRDLKDDLKEVTVPDVLHGLHKITDAE